MHGTPISNTLVFPRVKDQVLKGVMFYVVL